MSDIPLQCKFEKGRIVIEIGDEVLAHATDINPDLYDDENDRGLYRVTNYEVFAKELVSCLNEEDEEGATRVTRMLDEAIYYAIDQGAEGVEENT